jgi:hypothetical protein
MTEPLTHEQLFELIADMESAIRNLRNGVVDGLYCVESRNRVLERQNRELRGELEQLKGRTERV